MAEKPASTPDRPRTGEGARPVLRSLLTKTVPVAGSPSLRSDKCRRSQVDAVRQHQSVDWIATALAEFAFPSAIS
jgi:hypothetical protein